LSLVRCSGIYWCILKKIKCIKFKLHCR
jgi:hypothetical protein